MTATDIPVKRVTRNRKSGWLRLLSADLAVRILPGLLFCVLLAAGWEAMARMQQSPLIPGLADIFVELQSIVISGELATDVGTTLGRLALGFLLAFIIAIGVGLVSARNRVARYFFEPALLLGLTVPGLVWALLCVIWFGLSLKTRSRHRARRRAGTRRQYFARPERVDPQLIEAAHVYRFSSRRGCVISGCRQSCRSSPAARLAFSLAWKVVVLVAFALHRRRLPAEFGVHL